MTVNTNGSIQQLIDQHRAEQFLYREGRLLDERRFDEWLALWSEDGIYWVPANGEETDPTREVSLIYDNHERLRTRLERYTSASAHSQDPAPRTTRVISNVEYERSGERWEIRSTFRLAESRPGVRADWAGRTRHVLLGADGPLTIESKTVVLVDNDQELTVLDFLL